MLLAVAILAAGCAGSRTLLAHGGQAGAGPRPRRDVAARYLEQLSAAQSRLGRAEAALPARPRTPAALSHTIGLLARAIDRLAVGLAAIHPPLGIAVLHRRLVSIAGGYHQRLVVIARQARRPELEVAAANSLARVTGVASDALTSTFARIRRRLGG